MTIIDPGPRPGHDGRDTVAPSPLTLPSRPDTITLPPRPGTLTAARNKVALTFNATDLNAIKAPNDKPRLTFGFRLPDRVLTAGVAAKSPRKAQTAIREAGVHNIVLLLQGRLIAGDVIASAGLSAQPKAAKPPQAP